MEVITKSAEETKEIGRRLAADIIATSDKRQATSARVFALTGDLGSGKTTFVQGFAQGLGINARLISPTFIIVRRYLLPVTSHQSLVTSFYHVDLYRLEKDVENEIINLGIRDVWEEPGNIVAIEWAEKIKKIVPADAVWMKFENLNENERKITIR